MNWPRTSKIHWVGLIIGLLLLAAVARLYGAAPNPPQVQFITDNIGPRQIEDVTARNIPRDYARAWQTLATALEQNRAGVLDQYFVGFARTKFGDAIAAQQKSGIRTRYVDRGLVSAHGSPRLGRRGKSPTDRRSLGDPTTTFGGNTAGRQ